MDIMMPVMDGYDTIRAIRASEQYKSVTVIAVTGKVMAGERKRCLDAGADDYVPKPVDQAELFAAMRPWLPQAQDSPRRSPSPSTVSAEPRRSQSPSLRSPRSRRSCGARSSPSRRDRGQRPRRAEDPRGR